MIDKIRFSKKNLTDSEIKKIVDKNNLAKHYADGFTHWHNDRTKNFNGGLSIKIDKTKTLLVEGSLHKYSTYLSLKKLDNFDCFTMVQAKETYLKMIKNVGFEPINATLREYEIGINLVSSIDPKEILKNIYSIGDLTTEKKFYIDPKYKKESQITTEKHKDYRVFYRTYDKIHEMLDAKKAVPDFKIIRIETVQKRVEKTFLIDFFTDANLKRLQNAFFDKWDKLNFLVEITAPPKTGTAKIELAKKLYKKSKSDLLHEILTQYKNNTNTIKSYYTQKRFIENWENERINFVPTKSIVFLTWEKMYNSEKQIHTLNKNLK